MAAGHSGTGGKRASLVAAATTVPRQASAAGLATRTDSRVLVGSARTVTRRRKPFAFFGPPIDSDLIAQESKVSLDTRNRVSEYWRVPQGFYSTYVHDAGPVTNLNLV